MKSKTRTLLKLLSASGLIICASACAPLRQVTVINASEDVVRLGKGVRGPVYTQDATGKWTLKGVMELPEGWYAGPMK